MVTVALQHIDPHKQIAIAEGCLGDVHLLLLHKFLGATQRRVVVQFLDVVLRRHPAINLGKLTHLETTFCQRLQELILSVRISIHVRIAVVV